MSSSTTSVPQVTRLSKQLATLEVKELNERQKSDHMEGQYKLVQVLLLHCTPALAPAPVPAAASAPTFVSVLAPGRYAELATVRAG